MPATWRSASALTSLLATSTISWAADVPEVAPLVSPPSSLAESASKALDSTEKANGNATAVITNKKLRGLGDVGAEAAKGHNGPRTCASAGCNAPYIPAESCQCNEYCNVFSNCCDDYWETCRAHRTTTTPPSSDSCSTHGCDAPYKPWLPCQCNSLCHKFNNCCNDYEAICSSSGGGGSSTTAAPPTGEEPSPVPSPAPHPGPTRGYIPSHQAPTNAFEYKGMAWPDLVVSGTGEMHFFAIGDWGGLDGSLETTGGRPRLIAYYGGHTAGPHVFPRNRYNKDHSDLLCTHEQLVECYGTDGKGDQCVAGCGYVEGVDDEAQLLVASALKSRAASADPKFIVNVGDNFYWGGIEVDCGQAMGQITPTARHQFNQIFEGVYSGAGLSGKPWLSVLGNHDWGGRVFNNGWDQQIAYTWASSRWLLPAPYWYMRVNFQDLGFDVDIFMVDSNVEDAMSPEKDPEHNICGREHNPSGASCAAAGGPASVDSCPGFFDSLMEEQRTWLENKMGQSQANWQIVNTHFPCGHQSWWYRKLRTQFGLDLLITGHRHDQELWSNSGMLGGLTCVVTGGGGGISSEASPGDDHSEWYGQAQYGFFDFTISKERIFVENINYDGTVVASSTVYPH